jgi:ADP-heptose:LPS heptosyltransferase
VHTLPLAAAIKALCPQAFVGWVVEKGAASVVKQCPAVDETIIAPKGFLKSPSSAWKLWRTLRERRFQIALDPQSLTKSALCGWFSGAPVRVGFARPIGRELAPWLHTHAVVPRETHVVQRYLEVLQPFLDSPAGSLPVQFPLPPLPAAEQAMQQFVSRHGLREFAVINPGAGWDSKLWPHERLAAVARGLTIPSVVVWAGQRERDWAEAIVAGAGGHAILAPPTTLLELTELVRLSRLFVGSDTGPLHIAAAVQTPCVAIFGPTNPAVCGPFGSGHCVVQAKQEDLGSARKAKGLVSDAMLLVTAEEVLAACEKLLSHPRAATQAA